MDIIHESKRPELPHPEGDRIEALAKDRDDVGERSAIADWLAGKCVLVTGGTGFMGKVLVEKLLRSCPDIRTLYMIVRGKHNTEALARKEQYLKCVIFNKVLSTHPEVINKLRLIKGDLLEPGLGLSETDAAELAEQVSVVFHCAANVRFDQPLRPIIKMNVAGTLSVLQLVQRMRQLEVFVHTSTSYSQCNEAVVEERAYAAPQNPYDILELVANTPDDRELAEMTPGLLNGQPNTYAYSKSLCEDLVCRFAAKLPIVIARPSIVTAALQEPLPGWIEGINGPTGLMIGAARGVIRSMHCNPDFKSTIIPVDLAINGLIVAGYQRATAGAQSNDKVAPEFYNLCVPSKTLPSWGECIDIGRRFFYQTPLSFSLWYPDGSVKSNYWHHLFCVIFFHHLPAYFIDFWLMVLRKKPFLVRVQNKVSAGLKLLQYYTTKEFSFRCERFQQLADTLNDTDQMRFNTCTAQVNWELYMRQYILGMRQFIIGESDDTIPYARRVLWRLYILDRCATYIFAALVFWFLWTHLDSVVESSDGVIRNYLQYLYGGQGGNSTMRGGTIESNM